MIHCLTIDVEDWYHYYPIEKWHQFPSRVIEPIQWILGQLKKRNIKATFFILGYIAERHPELIREIFLSGHEIGCHGYDHKLVFMKTPQEYDMDIKKALDKIEIAAGYRPDIYRAPSFSISPQTLWVWKILYKNGIRRDSSVRVGRWETKIFNDFPNQPFRYKFAPNRYIEEYPLYPLRLFGTNIFFPGGGYFRILPKKLIKKYAENSKRPIIFYIHPRDLDPGQPRIKEFSLVKRWFTYCNVEGCRKKLIALLDSLEFRGIKDTFRNDDMIEIDFKV